MHSLLKEKLGSFSKALGSSIKSLISLGPSAKKCSYHAQTQALLLPLKVPIETAGGKSSPLQVLLEKDP